MLPSAVDQIKSGIKSPHTNQSILWKLILLVPEESLALCRWQHLMDFSTIQSFFPIVGISKYGIDS